MISASSSSTLRAARRLVVEPLICLGNRQSRTEPLGPQKRQSHKTGTPVSERPPRQPPQPVPKSTRLKPGSSRPSAWKAKAKSPDDGRERPKKLLQPYELSTRLVKLASEGQLDEAIVMLQNSPLDASNVKTWNTLLLQCMKEERFKLGYKLYIDVRAPLSRPMSGNLISMPRVSSR